MVAVLLSSAAVIVVGDGVADLPWILARAAVVGFAALVRTRRPEAPLSGWFALVAGLSAIEMVPTGVLELLIDVRGTDLAVVMTNFLAQLLAMASVIASSRLLGLFPNGVYRNRRERRVLASFWLLFLVPCGLLLATPVAPISEYLELPAVANPLHVLPFSLNTTAAETVMGLASLSVVAAVLMLVNRYRFLGAVERGQVRVLTIPIVVGVFAGVANLIVALPAWIAPVAFILIPVSLAAVVALALLSPAGIDLDSLLRRSVLYGGLWLVIAVAYVGGAATLGLAVGERVSIGWTVTLTVIAMLALQPVRMRLELAADRWVFGIRPDPTEAIAKLGSTLAETYELESLPARMESALVQGLGLEWARVRISSDEPSGAPPPLLSVPIVLGDENVGAVECGPRVGRPLSEADEAVVAALARQAALAVRNLRLTRELADKAAELAASRTRLVRAEEAERRRIERNIHDGVQQDLVALIGQAGRVHSRLGGDPVSTADELATLQAGMQRVLADLRELASGIHPSLLRDRGLLAAIEGLAARNPLPVSVRADPALRDLRLAEEVEGACYYTVAESLANTLKHADATRVEITLTRENGSLLVQVADDGVGFDGPSKRGNGLGNLAERLAALGGSLEVSGHAGEGTRVSARLVVGHEESSG